MSALISIVLATSPLWTTSVSDGILQSHCTRCERVTHYGARVAAAGDVNGDGHADLLIGAPQFGPSHEGKLFVYHGASPAPSTTPDWTLTSTQLLNMLGAGVAAAGDVNGDGFDDVVVTHVQVETLFGPNPWRVRVFHGSEAGLSQEPALDVVSSERMGGLGVPHAAGVGDVNRDGFDDVLIGVASTEQGSGKVYLHLGSSGGTQQTAAWTASGDGERDALFGFTVSAAGDINRDGYADFAVGAPGQGGAGKVFVYRGGRRIAGTAAWTVSGDGQPGAQLGTSVAAGDVNGDGASDLIVGAPGYDGSAADTGRAYVYLGSRFRRALEPAWTFTGTSTAEELGASVSAAGDVDGDGRDDVLVGAPRTPSESATGPGRVLLFLGRKRGLSQSADWELRGEHDGDELGKSVAVVRDVDGDGRDDVLVGAPGFAEGTGKVSLYGRAAAKP